MRVVLGIEYDGATFSGWQRQNHVASVQKSIEDALAKIANTPVTIHCAGRTDAGVHATGQVVHFDSPVVRPERAWTMGVNTHLPDTVAVTWSREVDAEFHARYSATARRYRYIIYNAKLRPGIHTQGVTHEYRPLDAEKMHRAAQCLIGENDFSAFRAAHCQSTSPFRNLTAISVRRQGHYVIVDVEGNAFLHHMVRNITGSLLNVGSGEQPTEWIKELLDSKDRTKAGATAKPNGLYLVRVSYPDKFGLPVRPPGPLFLPD
ncbi:tRNA pseudouridine(38-40) synthase TruA [Alteromonas flava]|uniref:tRNA pseudouridine(38-40) synthase TruA n=1 Tax=Alteromonas flava TaxID=2048003 RepID=UPI000C284F38|nr:tRNA pseudouridine(38-40) synthase TruA [Alteromonas flava]